MWLERVFFPFPTILELPLQLNPGRIRPNTKWSTFHFQSHHIFELWNSLPSEIVMANFEYLKRSWTNSCSIYDIYSWNEGLLDAFKKAFMVTNGSHKWRSQLRIKTPTKAQSCNQVAVVSRLVLRSGFQSFQSEKSLISNWKVIVSMITRFINLDNVDYGYT